VCAVCVLCGCGSCGCCKCAVIWLAGTRNCCAGLLLLGCSVSLPCGSSYCTAMIKSTACGKGRWAIATSVLLFGLAALLSTTPPLQSPAIASGPHLPDVGTRIVVTLLHFHGPGLRARSYPSPKHICCCCCASYFATPDQAHDNKRPRDPNFSETMPMGLVAALEQGKSTVVSKGLPQGNS